MIRRSRSGPATFECALCARPSRKPAAGVCPTPAGCGAPFCSKPCLDKHLGAGYCSAKPPPDFKGIVTASRAQREVREYMPAEYVKRLRAARAAGHGFTWRNATQQNEEDVGRNDHKSIQVMDMWPSSPNDVYSPGEPVAASPADAKRLWAAKKETSCGFLPAPPPPSSLL